MYDFYFINTSTSDIFFGCRVILTEKIKKIFE